MATTTSLAFSSSSLHNRYHKRTTFFNGSAASFNRIGVRRSLVRSGVFMSVSVGKHTAVTVDDALFADYKPTNAFLFPGQVCVFIFVAWNFWVFILIFRCFVDSLWKKKYYCLLTVGNIKGLIFPLWFLVVLYVLIILVSVASQGGCHIWCVYILLEIEMNLQPQILLWKCIDRCYFGKLWVYGICLIVNCL